MANTDNVSPGPKRWERAINGAKNSPNSAHAVLLRTRLETVKHLDREPNQYWRVQFGAYGEKNHYYCSDFCAGIAMHLEATFNDEMTYQSVAELVDAIRYGYNAIDLGRWAELYTTEPSQLPRTVKCFACGGKMLKTKLTSTYKLVDFDDALSLLETKPSESYSVDVTEPKVVEEKKVTIFLDNDGELFESLPEMQEVTLTEREIYMLRYIPRGIRRTVVSQLEHL